jgi:hypothetical protein
MSKRQNRRLWVRLHEKGGKRHPITCHHNLDESLGKFNCPRPLCKGAVKVAHPDPPQPASVFFGHSSAEAL